MSRPVAIITGITGQDGSYLTELLLEKGYEVHGLVRRSSNIDRKRLDHLTQNEDVYNKTLFLHYADLSDTTSIRRLIHRIRPSEFYHLAGQSHVGLSFEIPESTAEFTAMGTLSLLEILRDMDQPPRFLNMGSSEIFGAPEISPQNEKTPLRPTSPYGVAKAFAVQMVSVYRKSFGLFCCSAISYNHESPRRGDSFVTQKIARSVAEIAAGKRDKLLLGNLDVTRDWGYAPEYVEAMWRMLQHDEAKEFILATGRSTTLKEFLTHAFSHVGLDWEKYVEIDPRFVRPTEPTALVGDPSRIAENLGWVAKTDVASLTRIMVDHQQKVCAGQTSELIN